jgi:anti-sigma factor RsiW
MVISCDSCRDELSCFVDQQLDENRHADISSHLSTCNDCKDQLETMQSLSRFLSEGAAMESPAMPDLWAKISQSMPTVCEVIQDDLSAYLDGELTPAAQEGVQAHIKACDPCRENFTQLNATNQFVSKGLALPESMKVDLWPAVKSRLNEDCALMQSELSAFLDQEVVTLRHRAITSHLTDCPTCCTRFDELSQVGETIRNFYQPEIPESFDLWPAIKSQMQVIPITSKSAKSKPKVVTHRLYLVGAAAVVFGLVGSLAFLFSAPNNTANIRPVTAEAYLLDSALSEPTDNPESAVYDIH